MNILQQAQAVLERNMDRRPSYEMKKAAFGTSDITAGGVLAPQQSSRLIRLLRYPPTLLRLVRLVPMKSPNDRLDRITFGSRILHAGTENTNLTASLQAKPDMSKVEMSAELFKAEIHLTYEVLQDTIEGGQNVRGNRLENTVISLISARLAEDMEDLMVNSDSSDGSLHADYQKLDGLLVLAEDQNTYDHSGAAVSKAAFKAGHKALPKQYRRNKKALGFFTGCDTEIEWADELADRATSNADNVAWGDKAVTYAYGMPVVPVSSMPEESGASSNLGKVLHTHPKNAICGVWRNFFFDFDKDVRAGALIVVVSLRFDVAFEQVEGAMVISNMKIA